MTISSDLDDQLIKLTGKLAAVVISQQVAAQQLQEVVKALEKLLALNEEA